MISSANSSGITYACHFGHSAVRRLAVLRQLSLLGRENNIRRPHHLCFLFLQKFLAQAERIVDLLIDGVELRHHTSRQQFKVGPSKTRRRENMK